MTTNRRMSSAHCAPVLCSVVVLLTAISIASAANIAGANRVTTSLGQPRGDHSIAAAGPNPSEITYELYNFPQGVTKKLVEEKFVEVFNTLSTYTRLSFKKVDSGSSHIRVWFQTFRVNYTEDTIVYGDKGKNYGSSYVLPNCTVFFKRNENYTDEIITSPEFFNKTLRGIAKVLGHYSVCADPTIDAAFTTRLYPTPIAFKDDRMYAMNKSGIINSTLISSIWPGLETPIDAAFEYLGTLYFFKGDKYWRYDNKTMEEGFPRNISVDFPTIPNDLDAATDYDGFLIFVKDRQQYNIKTYDIPIGKNHRAKAKPLKTGRKINAIFQISNNISAFSSDWEHQEKYRRTWLNCFPNS